MITGDLLCTVLTLLFHFAHLFSNKDTTKLQTAFCETGKEKVDLPSLLC